MKNYSHYYFTKEHSAIFQILAGIDQHSANCMLNYLGITLPFNLNHCQMIITGLSYQILQKTINWNYEKHLFHFSNHIRPNIQKFMEESGLVGDSYIFLFDKHKYCVSIFSPTEEYNPKIVSVFSKKIHLYLQDYFQSISSHNAELMNFTILSNPIINYDSIHQEFSKMIEQKEYQFFFNQCASVDQQWISENKKRFTHMDYDQIREKFRTDLLNNKTEHLQDYLKQLFDEFVIPSCDFEELKRLLLFLTGNMKIYSMTYCINKDISIPRFEYQNYSSVLACYRDVSLHLNRIITHSSYNHNYSEAIIRALTYIHTNYNRSICIEDVAEQAHLSPTYLSALVTNATGKTIHQHLLNTRMENARKLLKETPLSIDKISKNVGYETTKYFSKIFKKEHGCTPSQYRKKINLMD